MPRIAAGWTPRSGAENERSSLTARGKGAQGDLLACIRALRRNPGEDKGVAKT
jgi:hypothetical protein